MVQWYYDVLRGYRSDADLMHYNGSKVVFIIWMNLQYSQCVWLITYECLSISETPKFTRSGTSSDMYYIVFDFLYDFHWWCIWIKMTSNYLVSQAVPLNRAVRCHLDHLYRQVVPIQNDFFLRKSLNSCVLFVQNIILCELPDIQANLVDLLWRDKKKKKHNI